MQRYRISLDELKILRKHIQTKQTRKKKKQTNCAAKEIEK